MGTARFVPMTGIIGRVVGHGPESERVFIHVARVTQQRENEIAAAHVMRQVAEEVAPVGVVAHILNDGAAVGIGLSAA
ncbi:MAG: hypothetical protein PVS2B2_07850 [Candidatus Acidiferrum sp.]